MKMPEPRANRVGGWRRFGLRRHRPLCVRPSQFGLEPYFLGSRDAAKKPCEVATRYVNPDFGETVRQSPADCCQEPCWVAIGRCQEGRTVTDRRQPSDPLVVEKPAAEVIPLAQKTFQRNLDDLLALAVSLISSRDGRGIDERMALRRQISPAGDASHRLVVIGLIVPSQGMNATATSQLGLSLTGVGCRSASISAWTDPVMPPIEVLLRRQFPSAIVVVQPCQRQREHRQRIGALGNVGQ